MKVNTRPILPCQTKGPSRQENHLQQGPTVMPSRKPKTRGKHSGIFSQFHCSVAHWVPGGLPTIALNIRSQPAFSPSLLLQQKCEIELELLHPAWRWTQRWLCATFSPSKRSEREPIGTTTCWKNLNPLKDFSEICGTRSRSQVLHVSVWWGKNYSCCAEHSFGMHPASQIRI